VLFRSKLLLDTKQTIINEIIGKARKRLAELSDDEYTDMILSMVKKYSHNKKGRLVFPRSDQKRLTKDFPEKLNAILSQKQGASLDIEEEALSFEGGFLLIYGDIEENCSFDALFAEERDELQDKVNSLLFD
jgi:V/A-type H+-transporting ATPase subunit E